MKQHIIQIYVLLILTLCAINVSARTVNAPNSSKKPNLTTQEKFQRQDLLRKLRVELVDILQTQHYDTLRSFYNTATEEFGSAKWLNQKEKDWLVILVGSELEDVNSNKFLKSLFERNFCQEDRINIQELLGERSPHLANLMRQAYYIHQEYFENKLSQASSLKLYLKNKCQTETLPESFMKDIGASSSEFWKSSPQHVKLNGSGYTMGDGGFLLSFGPAYPIHNDAIGDLIDQDVLFSVGLQMIIKRFQLGVQAYGSNRLTLREGISIKDSTFMKGDTVDFDAVNFLLGYRLKLSEAWTMTPYVSRSLFQFGFKALKEDEENGLSDQMVESSNFSLGLDVDYLPFRFQETPDAWLLIVMGVRAGVSYHMTQFNQQNSKFGNDQLMAHADFVWGFHGAHVKR